MLVTPADLLAWREGGRPVRVLDVRWALGAPDGRAAYRAGHVPGAVYVDLETELSRHGTPDEGRHPLPDRTSLEAAARGWGVCAGDVVVAYDDAGSVPAARAWWLLRRSGLADVYVLDGGLAGWIAAGLPLETGAGPVEAGAVVPGDVVLGEIGDGVVSLAEAAAWPGRGALLDARAPERYRGEVEPVDPLARHIPGAANLPATELMENGRFRDAAALRAAFAAAGAGEGVAVAAYCGSGVTAAHTVLAGELAGIEVALFPGSWSAWTHTAGLPVATGAEPARVTGTTC